MEIIREIRELVGNKITLELPLSFTNKRVEILVLPIDKDEEEKTTTSNKKRTPSPLVKGTRIIGDIMSPIVPEEDWNALT